MVGTGVGAVVLVVARVVVVVIFVVGTGAGAAVLVVTRVVVVAGKVVGTVVVGGRVVVVPGTLVLLVLDSGRLVVETGVVVGRLSLLVFEVVSTEVREDNAVADSLVKAVVLGGVDADEGLKIPQLLTISAAERAAITKRFILHRPLHSRKLLRFCLYYTPSEARNR